jgi:hypothetical protein
MRRRPIIRLGPRTTIFYIRRHISKLPNNVPFSTRDFLSYGKRAAIDQCLSRMVKQEEIVRLARGLFIKLPDGAEPPSAYTVAKAKAEAFGRRIYTGGALAAITVGFSEHPHPITELTFAIAGHSSSFQYGNIRIKFKSTPSKYLKLEDSFPGLAIRAFLHFGKKFDPRQILHHRYLFLWREDKYALRLAARWMPEWLAEKIYQKPAYDYAQLNLRRTFDSVPSRQHSTLAWHNEQFRAEWPGGVGVPI